MNILKRTIFKIIFVFFSLTILTSCSNSVNEEILNQLVENQLHSESPITKLPF